MHVREAPEIGLEVPVVRAHTAFPRVVHDDVAIAGVAHATLDQRVSGLAYQLIGHERAEAVPRVPAHRRRRCEAVGERAESHLCRDPAGGQSFGLPLGSSETKYDSHAISTSCEVSAGGWPG